MHNGEMPFKYDQCNKSFANRGPSKEHSLIKRAFSLKMIEIFSYFKHYIVYQKNKIEKKKSLKK